MKIMVDAGHNASGADTGAAGFGLREQDVTYGIAAKLKPMLKAAGHEVRLTRYATMASLGGSVNESLSLRCQMANEWGAELFISIHCNASDNASAHGSEVYSYQSGTMAARYARRIQNALVSRLKTADRGAKTAGYYVLKHTNCPAVLVETAFITNAADNALLSARQADFAAAVCEGVTGQKPSEQSSESEDLTMTQYEELKREIEQLKHPMIYNYVDENMPEWAREGVIWAIDNGIITGTGDGLGLDDKDLKYCTMMMRMMKGRESK